MSNPYAAWPPVNATVRDGEAELNVGGRLHVLRHDDQQQLRAELNATIAEHADRLGRPLAAVIEEDGQQWGVLVHADGRVENHDPAKRQQPTPRGTVFDETAAPAPATPRAPAATAAHGFGDAAPPTLPHLSEFLSSADQRHQAPAEHGWRAGLRRATGGLITLGPGAQERRERADVASIQRSLAGPRTICVVNPKGGASKTTAVLMLAATFGMLRGGYTLAWDNNETIGNLATRAAGARHQNTAVDLLRDLDRFTNTGTARVGDLDNYVRSQGDARFDALASDLDPAGAASIDADAFGQLHTMLERFYRIIVVDTGNNMRASNWEAAVAAADQLVVATNLNRDVGYGGAVLIDRLRSLGLGHKVEGAVTLLSEPTRGAQPDADAPKRRHYFEAHTRVVLDIPFEPIFKDGGPLNVHAVSEPTRRAWVRAAAEVAEGL